MIKNIELEKGAYQFDAKMPLRQAIPLGLQHVFAMFVGNLTPLLIITSACGLAGGEFADLQVSLLQNAMFVAGVVTLVQLFSIGPVGGQVPIIMGTSSGFLGVFNSVAASMGGGVLAYGAIMGASILGGLFETVLGFFLKPLRKFFPSVVTGTVVLSIGLSLISVGVNSFGGGNAAIDVARAAKRLTGGSVNMYCLEKDEEMPTVPDEKNAGIADGVVINNSWAPKAILGEDGKVTGIRVERMTLGEPDEKGRRKPVGTGEFETLAVDSVIGAIGQTVDWGTLDTGALTTTKKGTAEADALTYQTAQPDIFVGGDCYTGPKFAIDAIAAGKEAAISLHRYVHPGQTLTAGRDRRVYKALDKDHVLIETAGFDKDHRQTPGYNAAKAKTFSDARVTFTEEQVRKECARCLGCGATKVDSYLCIGCGLCTTKCKFDAIHLKKVRDWHAKPFEAMPIKVAENLVKRTGGIVKKAVAK